MKGDHPRIRGEHLEDYDPMVIDEGSSPHPRGALFQIGSGRCAIRIIPASAGSTHAGSTGPPPWEDHPRIRGEHVLALWVDDVIEGSSPHPRGARPPPSPRGSRTRIIPASAGSTAL